jgi:2-oxoglutarate dehydrogenase E2 component (dihydrolipoamide succinyltransferase)
MIIEFKMPKMGESISEATIINWLKNVGDVVEAEETILEVATDKVDSEVPSPVTGIITEIRYQKDAVVAVGETLALIEVDANAVVVKKTEEKPVVKENATVSVTNASSTPAQSIQLKSNPDAFLSPLIVSIAQKENLSLEEVQSIPGTGADGRIRKSDVFNYLKNRKYPIKSNLQPTTQNLQPSSTYPKPVIAFNEEKDYIIEMDRMRKMIADHMVYSKQTSPHVTSYLEVDVTNLVNWRNAVKDKFQEKYNEKLTFTPVFIDAVARAIADFH